jgi:hypothetical protein
MYRTQWRDLPEWALRNTAKLMSLVIGPQLSQHGRSNVGSWHQADLRLWSGEGRKAEV